LRFVGGILANLKFEAALSRLEELVGSLEKGDLSLEESLKIFEEGVRLSKNCTKILDEAEKKVELLIHDKEGKKRIHPLDIPDLNNKENGNATTATDVSIPSNPTETIDEEEETPF
jgi:exodeoxyribonuclease VII small subunit